MMYNTDESQLETIQNQAHVEYTERDIATYKHHNKIFTKTRGQFAPNQTRFKNNKSCKPSLFTQQNYNPNPDSWVCLIDESDKDMIELPENYFDDNIGIFDV